MGRNEDRADDSEEVFNNRMRIYKETISNIEEFYEHDNLLKVIDGEQEIDAVVKEIDTFIKSHITLS